jgi:hypothetical protein
MFIKKIDSSSHYVNITTIDGQHQKIDGFTNVTLYNQWAAFIAIAATDNDTINWGNTNWYRLPTST